MVDRYLHYYCERAGEAGIWAEPVNAISNAAFLIAALWMVWTLRGIPLRRFPDGYLLTLMITAIGIGSGAWHLHPTGTTLAMDVLPITLFINLYLMAFLWRAFGLRWYWIALAVLGLQGLNATAGALFPPDTLNGTLLYLPTLLVMGVMTLVSWRIGKPFWLDLLLITGIWTTSLAFRTMDGWVCGVLPMGTHFLWHIANAVVLFELLCLLSRLIPCGRGEH